MNRRPCRTLSNNKWSVWRGSEWYLIESRHINARVCRCTIRSHEEVLHGDIGLIELATMEVGSLLLYLTALTAEVDHLLRRGRRPFGGTLLALGRKSIMEYTIR